MSNWLVN